MFSQVLMRRHILNALAVKTEPKLDFQKTDQLEKKLIGYFSQMVQLWFQPQQGLR